MKCIPYVLSVDAAERQSLLALSKVVHEVSGGSVILYLIVVLR